MVKGSLPGWYPDGTRMVRLDLEYAVTDWLTFGAYIAYYDYWFDGNMREAAAAYNGEWGARYDQTWNVVGGLSVTATF